MPHLNTVLTFLRINSTSQKAKGTYFEKLCVAFLRQDPGMQQQFGKVWLYADWAKANSLSETDTGIDIVAEVRDGGLCAAQCKFYAQNHAIQKPDIDSFFTESGKHNFTRRLIFDTTNVAWGKNAEDALANQQIETIRIALDRLDEAVDWSNFIAKDKTSVTPKKQPRPHQVDALKAVKEGLATAARGKVLMACGTGKTFTALKFAEDLAGAGKWVLYLVPSLSLMSQSIREWTIDSETPLRARAVCSDTEVGRRKSNKDDVAEFEAQDLDSPATTNPARLAASLKAKAPERMTVVFATYQSIQVVAIAQRQHALPEFDLIVCDEAHRTTGVIFPGDESQDSNFVKVHDQSFLAGKKRIYMTATPRIYGDAVKTKAGEESVELCSMDDPAIYGETLFERGFGWAVENGLLTDYKVIVLAVDEAMVSAGLQARLADSNNELKLDDATKIIGCYKALTKSDLKVDVGDDVMPMHRGLAFCRDIASSKLIQNQFAATISDFLASEEGKENEEGNTPLSCELEHVDGTFAATARTRLLDWLKESPPGEVCRILTNARCLSEGVDVPALDAILFMHPRKSQIDVVQSVGRVMRRAEGKKMGYVILPIGIPAGVNPEDALNDNERYRVVWQILNALRSHDERLDATINKISLNEDVSGKIEVIAVSNKLPVKKEQQTRSNIGHGSAPDDDSVKATGTTSSGPTQGSFVFDEVSKAIMARIVRKCGTRDYWETWASDIADIAKAHITRITALVKKSGTRERAAFETFLGELREDLNDSVSMGEAIEMLAQHLITRPVFDSLFEGYSFAKANPVSLAMQKVLDTLNEHNLEKEAESLQKFYDSVRRRAAGIKTAAAKQQIIVELYEKFFKTAFTKMTDRLGIVYTPVEVVDFIIHSVNEVLKSEFNQTVGSKGVHIIDPFTGTGTFITRLLQSGLIKAEELEHKYRHELHANEIVLLAYYIAAINIESTYHAAAGGDYVPFDGICLTDTFYLYEQSRDLVSALLADNSKRLSRQKQLDIRVIIGNPPYSSGQENENDDNKNVEYPKLDEKIASTYLAQSSKQMGKSKAYDSYIRAIRWGTDRLGKSGVLAFVSGSAWIERSFADGMRRTLINEFTHIYVIHLRGDVRKNILSKGRAREGENIFGSNSMTGIAITLFVKKAGTVGPGKISYLDIGNDLSRSDKLNALRRFKQIKGIKAWQDIAPDEHGDWINQRKPDFSRFLRIATAKGSAEQGIFCSNSMGIKSNRDTWVYNFSQLALKNSMEKTISFYQKEVSRMKGLDASQVDASLNRDEKNIKWTTDIVGDLVKERAHSFRPDAMVPALYRPFQKMWYYSDKSWSWTRHLMPSYFPDENVDNKVICVSGVGARAGFSALMTDLVPNLHTLDTGQCFPFFIFDSPKQGTDDDLFSGEGAKRAKGRDGITDAALLAFRKSYPDKKIIKKDIFYYVYGLLHSDEYRQQYADNLAKDLPRIPMVGNADDFTVFTNAGRQLGSLHCDYEKAKLYPVFIEESNLKMTKVPDLKVLYYVEQMKFAGTRQKIDKTTVIYNSNIKITGVPLEAYDYVINGKSALEWVMERQCVKIDKASGIISNANSYAVETLDDPTYPLKLFQRVITISLETMKIVRGLPALDIAEPRAL